MEKYLVPPKNPVRGPIPSIKYMQELLGPETVRMLIRQAYWDAKNPALKQPKRTLAVRRVSGPKERFKHVLANEGVAGLPRLSPREYVRMKIWGRM